MEIHPNSFRADRPASLKDDILLKRILDFRRERQELFRDHEQSDRMKLESALAELEEEALKRGLKYFDR